MRRYLIAGVFTTADLTLATLMRPAVLVPYIRWCRGWTLGQVHWLAEKPRPDRPPPHEIPSAAVARNDQQSIGRWPLVRGPFWDLRLKATCGLRRAMYR